MGQLPDELPIELPLIEQGQVIASLQYGQTSAILMQIPQPLLLIQNWYSNRLRALGWFQYDADADAVERNSFVRTTQVRQPLNLPLIFCYRPVALTLALHTCVAAEHSTTVRLELAQEAAGLPCQVDWERSIPNLLPLPLLVPPTDTAVPPAFAEPYFNSRRAGGSEKDWYSKSQIQTALNGQALLAHYEEQLKQAGWTHQAGEARERLLWSVWTLQDRKEQVWQLTLSLVGDNNRYDRYVASLQMLNLDHAQQVWALGNTNAGNSVESIPESIFWQLLANNAAIDPETHQFWIGELPPTFPISWQFPSQFQILGSLVEEENQADVFLEVALPVSQTRDFLATQFRNSGWREWRELAAPEGIGFVVSRLPQLVLDGFIHPNNETRCLLKLYPITRESTDARLCCFQSPAQTDDSSEGGTSPLLQEQLQHIPIPQLDYPNQTEVVQAATEIRDQSVSLQVFISTLLPVKELVKHYQSAMRQAGWQQQTVTQSENCYYSLWSAMDEQNQSWQGKLSLIADPRKVNYYTGFLQIEPLNYSA
ncbi:MAG: hypothetical protein HC895_01355 [Leptolyngbyaceae cyanobacterium SM1_3_5]|nr:hypothetical protein [Leptolyngbyaceae cyanobacterium SM1_3_5]